MSKRILDHSILGKTEARLKKLETLASNARSLGLDMNVVDANPILTTLAYCKRSVEMGVRYFTGATVHSTLILKKVLLLQKIKR